VFGLSFGELVVLLLVAVVVLGPKEMPRYLRKAGQLAGQLRRMAYDMRAKSGIDEVLRSEGIGSDIAEIRRLATFARGELGGIMTAVRTAANGAGLQEVASNVYAPVRPAAPPAILGPNGQPVAPALAAPVVATPIVLGIDRDREYPTGGADTYGALPEDATVYEGQLPPSELAADPLYARGDDDGNAAAETAQGAEASP
jgi:sec-independent protein translocase protein TatB